MNDNCRNTLEINKPQKLYQVQNVDFYNFNMPSEDFIYRWQRVNSQAVGWDSWIPSALKSIFLGDLNFESAAWFFVIILKFIFTPISGIKNNEKIFLDTKKISFSRPTALELNSRSFQDRIFIFLYCRIRQV